MNSPFSLNLTHSLPPPPQHQTSERKRDKGKQKMVLSDDEPRPRVKLPGDSVVKLTLRLGGPTAAAASSSKHQADYQPSAGSSSEDDESFSPASQSTSLPKPRGRPSKVSGAPLTKEERELKKLGVAQRREKREMARREKAWREMEEAEKNAEESEEEEGSEEEEEAYGGILGEEEREVGERKPEEEDRRRWERARDQAEQNALRDFALSVASPSTPSAALPESLTPLPLDLSSSTPFSPHSLSLALLHRPTRASFPQLPTQSSSSVLEAQSQPPTPFSEPFQIPKGLTIPVGNIKTIRFGEYEIGTWYQAPFPEEFSRVPEGRLWY
ncbi:hypothetical protein P7C70_g7725, partial [Phenoliferia sp. Uapishka_3]